VAQGIFLSPYHKTLKSLLVDLEYNVEESCLSAFCIDIAAMLQDNTSLERLTIRNEDSRSETIKFEQYVALVTVLQHNTTLKTLRIHHNVWPCLNRDESVQMVSLLKKNYALESLPDIDLENEAGDVGAILRLNEAGRRYLIQDGSSVSKGVKVLSKVNTDINCVFIHLLENPRLCDRSAVEMVSDSNTDNGGSASLVHHIGKREHGRAQDESKESRRRLA
jgi:hypothetical protein